MRTPEQKRQLTKQRRQAMKSAGVRLPRRKVVPRQLHPIAIERAYYRDIIDLLEFTLDDVREKLIPRLPSIIAQYQSETRVDTYGETISTIFNDLRLGVARTMTDPTARTLGDRYAVRTNAFNEQQVDKQFKTVLGISVLREEPWLIPQMNSFVEKNAQLIKSIPEEYLTQLEPMVRTTVEQGVTATALERQILLDMEIKDFEPTVRGARRINPKARARLIARDQVSKFNGQLNKLRQTEMGVEKYTWATSRDARVRPSHAALEGKTFSWNKPPAIGHPGEDYQCRCSAIPVMDKFFGVGEVVPVAPVIKPLPIPRVPRVKKPVPIPKVVKPKPRVPTVIPELNEKLTSMKKELMALERGQLEYKAGFVIESKAHYPEWYQKRFATGKYQPPARKVIRYQEISEKGEVIRTHSLSFIGEDVIPVAKKMKVGEEIPFINKRRLRKVELMEAPEGRPAISKERLIKAIEKKKGPLYEAVVKAAQEEIK